MNIPRHITFYLSPSLLEQAREGHNAFIATIINVLEEDGFTTALNQDDEAGLRHQAENPGYSIVERQAPHTERTLFLRSAYFRPFWHIERSPVRWRWPVAEAEFKHNATPDSEAKKFFKYWSLRLFPDSIGRSRDGIIFVPLQDHLLEKRPFQSASAVEMVATLAEAFPEKRIVVRFRRGETYSEDERLSVRALEEMYTNVQIGVHADEHYLRVCDLVASQNSAHGFHGYFFSKPALFFAQTDCHHIAASVPRQGLKAALRTAREQMDERPNFAHYVHWFWQDQSINAGHALAPQKVRAALHHAGWPVQRQPA